MVIRLDLRSSLASLLRPTSHQIRCSSNLPIPLPSPISAFKSYVFRSLLSKTSYLEPFRSYGSKHSKSSLKNPPLAKRVVIVGSGGLSIGQAGEFDYSGNVFNISSNRINRISSDQGIERRRC